MAAEQIGGSRAPLIFYASLVGAAIAAWGLGAPAVVRTALGGFLVGFTAVFLTEGIRRRRAGDHAGERRDITRRS